MAGGLQNSHMGYFVHFIYCCDCISFLTLLGACHHTSASTLNCLMLSISACLPACMGAICIHALSPVGYSGYCLPSGLFKTAQGSLFSALLSCQPLHLPFTSAYKDSTHPVHTSTLDCLLEIKQCFLQSKHNLIHAVALSKLWGFSYHQ